VVHRTVRLDHHIEPTPRASELKRPAGGRSGSRKTSGRQVGRRDLSLLSRVLLHRCLEWLPNLERLVSCCLPAAFCSGGPDHDTMHAYAGAFLRQALLARFICPPVSEGVLRVYEVWSKRSAQIETTDSHRRIPLPSSCSTSPYSDRRRAALEEYVGAHFERAKGRFDFRAIRTSSRSRRG